jgi:hypothetical protein
VNFIYTYTHVSVNVTITFYMTCKCKYIYNYMALHAHLHLHNISTHMGPTRGSSFIILIIRLKRQEVSLIMKGLNDMSFHFNKRNEIFFYKYNFNFNFCCFARCGCESQASKCCSMLKFVILYSPFILPYLSSNRKLLYLMILNMLNFSL